MNAGKNRREAIVTAIIARPQSCPISDARASVSTGRAKEPKLWLCYSRAELSRERVRITLDDFGRGYLSLPHLRYFPIDGSRSIALRATQDGVGRDFRDRIGGDRTCPKSFRSTSLPRASRPSSNTTFCCRRVVAMVRASCLACPPVAIPWRRPTPGRRRSCRIEIWRCLTVRRVP